MVAFVVFGVIGACWAMAGIMLVTVPAFWNALINNMLSNPLSRLLTALSVMVAGTSLILGVASPLRQWWWVALGALAIVKGMAILGLRDATRVRLLYRWARWPGWAHRLSGAVLLALAVLLLFDQLLVNG
jgi:uncharacterized protein YjeT (DUF2065 family)